MNLVTDYIQDGANDPTKNSQLRYLVFNNHSKIRWYIHLQFVMPLPNALPDPSPATIHFDVCLPDRKHRLVQRYPDTRSQFWARWHAWREASVLTVLDWIDAELMLYHLEQ